MRSWLFLLDTNICIYHLPGASGRLWRQMERHMGKIATSSICYGEVMPGVAKAGEGCDAGAVALFRAIEVLPCDRAAAGSHARLPLGRARVDRLIAARSLALDAVLVTNNPADFRDIPDLGTENRAQ